MEGGHSMYSAGNIRQTQSLIRTIRLLKLQCDHDKYNTLLRVIETGEKGKSWLRKSDCTAERSTLRIWDT